ncbi:hypothetical protein [Microvirga sp. G4-2]|uniref:hypothetical protein n=1 Tax=Microvirga sp. G4-2 TaxID=3434467 RepID=UPI004043D06E
MAVSAYVDTRAERPWIVLKQTGLVAALILLPLFYALVPPLEDYPNHLARMHALASIPHNEALSQFYEVSWAPIPNLIMDLIVPPLTPFLGVYTAGRVFVGLTLLLMLLGPVLLQRVLIGRWSAWPLVGGLFVYNGFLFTGLMNYLFGVGVAVFGLAVWMRLSEKSIAIRALSSLTFCAVLYTCHLSALGLYGLGIASFEFWRLWMQKSWRPVRLLKSALALGLPFLPFLYLLVKSPTWGLSHEIVWETQGKLEAITLFLSVYSDITDIPFLMLIAVAIGIAVRRGLVRFHPAGLIMTGVLTTAFLAMPRMAFGSWMADQRLVVGIFFMTLGFISVDLKKLENHNAFFAVCLVAIAFRIVDVSAHWVAISQPLLELKTSLRMMQPGARLLVAQADDPADGPVDAALAHAPNLAVIERSALVSRLFVVPGKQILHARSDYGGHVDTEDGDTPTISRIIVDADEEGSSADGPHYWDKWPRFYDYLIVLGTDPDETANPAPDLLQIMHNGRGFQLYKVKKPS